MSSSSLPRMCQIIAAPEKLPDLASHCSDLNAGCGYQIRHGNRPLLPQALWVRAAWPA